MPKNVFVKKLPKMVVLMMFLRFVLAFPPVAVAQSIAINEVMASNNTTLADEDGDFEDWIELYNYGETPLNLLGFGLSDDEDNPFKWTFPDITLEPGEYLLVWASGKDRRPSSEQNFYRPALLREVYTEIPGGSVSDLVNHPKFPNYPDSVGFLTNGFEAPVNVGDHYGQRVQGYIKAPYSGEYIFWISSDDNGELYFSPDQNPENLIRIAHVPGWTAPREWDKFPQQESVPIYLYAGQYYYMMALMKENQGGDHLAVGWQFPDQTMNRPVDKQFTHWYATELHTNFRINREGEEIILTTPDGITADQLEPVSIPTDISYGRVPDGIGSWYFFNEPTPGGPNDTEGFYSVLDPPEFSLPGGFYTNDFELSFTHPESDVQIIYTLDGSYPDHENTMGKHYPYKNYYPRNPGDPFGDTLYHSFQSHVYDLPVPIYDRSDEPDKLTQISSTWENHPWYAPQTPVRKGIVVRARAYRAGSLPSPVITQSYFVTPESENPYSLPVFSFAIQEDELFDYFTGIYVAGQEFDTWRMNHPQWHPNGGTEANYRLRGMDQERPAHLEYFGANDANPLLSQDFGIRIHGGWSRAHPLKSIRLYARSLYGNSTFDYPFFPDRPDSSFKRLILRNGGNDYWSAYMRDAVYQQMVSHLDFGIQAYHPAVVFINGEYWGLSNLRERYDKHYVSRMYDVDPENIDLINVFNDAIAGNTDHYHALHSFVQQNSPALEENFQYIQTQMDISSFIDSQIANIFVGNTDWPGNNIRFWRLKTPSYVEGAPKGHDGRWRWLLLDTDFGFGIYGPNDHNTLAFATETNGPSWPNPSWSTLLLRRLLENDSFRIQFINRFADLLNTAFLPQRVTHYINQARELIEPEMADNIHRWRSAGGSVNQWNNNVDRMIQFADARPAYQRTHIQQQFSVPSQITITANINTPLSGTIRVNSVHIDPSTPGVGQDPYPWSGIYFAGVPVELEARPAPGYRFSHWEGYPDVESAVIEIVPSSNITLTAHFDPSDHEIPDQLIHYWHFNFLSGTANSILSDYSAVQQQGTITYPGTGDGYMDGRSHRPEDPVSNLNLLMAQQPDQGAVLRVRNPSDSRELRMKAPTSGFTNIRVSFATTRTSNGAKRQSFHYSADGGNTWNAVGQGYDVSLLPYWELKDFDLSQIENVENNPDLMFKILFWGESAAGSSGNNRLDNVSITGTALATGLAGAAGKKNQITLYPNPASQAFTLSIDHEDFRHGVLNLYCLRGKQLKSIAIVSHQTSVPVDDLPIGIYFVTFTSRLHSFSGKLVRQ